MILTDTEAKELAQDHDLPTLTIRATEAAILAKLRAGVEVPEPCNECLEPARKIEAAMRVLRGEGDAKA